MSNSVGMYLEKSKTYEERLAEYEEFPIIRSDEYFHPIYENGSVDLERCNQFLYHGIGCSSLTLFERILESKAIMCYNSRIKNGLGGISRYDCNGPDGISLAKWNNGLGSTYHNWIKSQLSLVIHPSCGAVKTIQIEEAMWKWMKEQNRAYKQRYSWLPDEWQVVGDIPLKHVVAVGLPMKYGNDSNLPSLNRVSSLMAKHDVKIPIVDTTDRNKILLIK